MTRQRKGSGLYPADTAPVTTAAPHISDDLPQRLANICATKPTVDQRAAALAYLTRTGNTDIAECLGLVTP